MGTPELCLPRANKEKKMNLSDIFDPHARPVDFDFVSVQRRVRNQDSGVLDSFRLPNTNLFLQNKSFFQV